MLQWNPSTLGCRVETEAEAKALRRLVVSTLLLEGSADNFLLCIFGLQLWNQDLSSSFARSGVDLIFILALTEFDVINRPSVRHLIRWLRAV